MKDTAYEAEMAQDSDQKRYSVDGLLKNPAGDEMELWHRAGHLSKLFLIVMLGVLPNLLMLTVIF